MDWDWVKIVGENLLPIVVTIIMPILVVLARKGIKWLEKKLDFDMSVENENLLLEYVQQGVAYAEEKAMQKLKVDPADMTPGQKKLDTALEFVREQVQRQGWDELAGEKLARLIEAALNKQRGAATTATVTLGGREAGTSV